MSISHWKYFILTKHLYLFRNVSQNYVNLQCIVQCIFLGKKLQILVHHLSTIWLWLDQVRWTRMGPIYGLSLNWNNRNQKLFPLIYILMVYSPPFAIQLFVISGKVFERYLFYLHKMEMIYLIGYIVSPVFTFVVVIW